MFCGSCCAVENVYLIKTGSVFQVLYGGLNHIIMSRYCNMFMDSMLLYGSAVHISAFSKRLQSILQESVIRNKKFDNCFQIIMAVR